MTTEDDLIAAVRARLAERGWNQQDLAYRAGLEPSTISRLLRKYHDSQLSVWLKIFEVLELDVKLVGR